MIYLVALLCLCAAPLYADSDEEALQARCIVEFWRDKEYELARQQAAAFLRAHPDSNYASGLRALLGDIDVQEGRYSEALTSYDQVADPALREKLLPSRQRAHLLLAQDLYEQGNFPEAVQELQDYLGTEPESPRAHLLLALCLYHGMHDLDGFLLHGERALELDRQSPEEERLHLSLFAVYIERGQNDPAGQTAAFLERGADHLYRVFQTHPEAIQQQNLFWLAQFYFGVARDYLSQDWQLSLMGGPAAAGQRAKAIWTMLLAHLTPAEERDCLKMATLLEWRGEREEQRALLLRLREAQEAEPEAAWKQRGATLLALGQVEEAYHRSDAAIAAYRSALAYRSEPAAVSRSKLRLARLTLHQLSPSDRSYTNPSFVEAISQLKELQVRRVLNEEPIHLEATLDYAEAAASAEAEPAREEKKLHLLIRAKEEMTTLEDLSAKDYELSRAAHPDKDLLVEAYRMLLDAKIILAEARLAASQGYAEESRMKEEAAHQLLTSLVSGRLAVTQYLVDQATAECRTLHAE